MTTAERNAMMEAVKGYQEIQKRNPFGSVAWLQASKEINAIAIRLAEPQ